MISDLIEQYLSDPKSSWPEIARKANALPVYEDLGGLLLVTPEREVLAVWSNQVWDEKVKFRPASDRGRLLALEALAKMETARNPHL